jgi:hypothetical protein
MSPRQIITVMHGTTVQGRTDGCLRHTVPAKACHMAKRSVGVQFSPSYVGDRALRGGVTRQGVVLD